MGDLRRIDVSSKNIATCLYYLDFKTGDAQFSERSPDLILSEPFEGHQAENNDEIAFNSNLEIQKRDETDLAPPLNTLCNKENSSG